MGSWVLKGLLWGVVIAGAAIAIDRGWCLGAGAVNWDQGCAHRLIPGPPPVFEIVTIGFVFPMTLWRANRRSRGLDEPWDWLRWTDDLPPSPGP